jgi:nucleotide-binding universal stress UspA family protein
MSGTEGAQRSLDSQRDSPEDSMIAIKNVLVATDFSQASVSALTYGRAVARAFKAKLHVLHMIDDLSRFAYPESTGVLPYAQMQGEMRRAAEQQMEAFVDESDRRELHAETILKLGSSAASEIIEYAKQIPVDLIIVGTTGRGAVDRMLMGSVADKVVRRAPCPVLAVHHPEHEFVMPDALQTVDHTKS